MLVSFAEAKGLGPPPVGITLCMSLHINRFPYLFLLSVVLFNFFCFWTSRLFLQLLKYHCVYRVQAWLVAQTVKSLPAMRETQVQSLGQEDPLETEMATHSSVLARKIPWMELPGGLPSMGSWRVGHNWVTCTLLGSNWKSMISKVRPNTHVLSTHVASVGLLRWLSGKESACQSRRHRRQGFDPSVGKIPCSRKLQPTPGFLPGKLHGERSLEGNSSWDCKELDSTELLSTVLLSPCILLKRLNRWWFRMKYEGYEILSVRLSQVFGSAVPYLFSVLSLKTECESWNPN